MDPTPPMNQHLPGQSDASRITFEVGERGVGASQMIPTDPHKSETSLASSHPSPATAGKITFPPFFGAKWQRRKIQLHLV